MFFSFSKQELTILDQLELAYQRDQNINSVFSAAELDLLAELTGEQEALLKQATDDEVLLWTDLKLERISFSMESTEREELNPDHYPYFTGLPLAERLACAHFIKAKARKQKTQVVQGVIQTLAVDKRFRHSDASDPRLRTMIKEIARRHGLTLDTLEEGADKFIDTALNRARNYRDADLTGADFHGGRSLYPADFRGAIMKGADLRGWKIEGANLSGVDLTGCDLSKYYSLSVLNHVDASNAIFKNANLERSIWQGANLSGADLSHSRLDFAILAGTDLTKADLSQASLIKAHLAEVHLSMLDTPDPYHLHFGPANLQGANLYGADLTSANLRGVNLRDADLRHCILTNHGGFDRIMARIASPELEAMIETKPAFIDFFKRLAAETLSPTQLQDAILYAADLREADLRDVSLEYADLRHANLQGTDLRGAVLDNADLRHTNLSASQLKSLASFDGAKLPQHLN